MNPIDQIADQRDKLKAKLNQAKAKLKKAKLRISNLSTQRLQALHTLHNANTANLRARAMICDAAGIPHDADILEWIIGAKERIARLEEAGDALKEEAWPTMFDNDASRKRRMDAIDGWTAAKEAKP